MIFVAVSFLCRLMNVMPVKETGGWRRA